MEGDLHACMSLHYYECITNLTAQRVYEPRKGINELKPKITCDITIPTGGHGNIDEGKYTL